MCEWITSSLRPEVFWVMATAILTLALVLVAWKQLRDLARTSRSDFLYKLKRDFFTHEETELMFLVENDLLVFNPNTPCFDTVEKNGIKPTKDALTTNVVDDVLLGPLEDVGLYWELKTLSLSEVYETFDYYIKSVVENKAIREYIEWCRREEGDEDIYDHLLAVYNQLKSDGPRIRKRKRRDG
jgi:hypothetical protein